MDSREIVAECWSCLHRFCGRHECQCTSDETSVRWPERLTARRATDHTENGHDVRAVHA